MRVIKKLLSIALASALLLGLVGPVSALAAPTMKDIKGHWAEQYIKDGVAHGYINGYENGTFKPDNPVSRAEFCKMVNNALGVSRSTGISFNDVSGNNWFYEDVRRAVSAGYITGDDRNNFNGDAQIKRRDAAVVISRIQTPPSSLNNMSEMVDVGEIPSYALEGAKAVYAKGYMTGDNNQRYRPDGNLTRAEAAKIIESILATENIVRDSAMLYQSGQSVANTLYVGDVTVPAGTTGTININNCRMLGNLEIAGGDAVNLASTGVNQLNVTNSSDRVEVRATGYSSVKNAVVNRGCSLTESSVSGDGFTNVQLTGTALKGEDVYLNGSFNNVVMNGAANLNLSSGTIAFLNVSANASGSKIYLARNTRVTLADVNTNCDFTGSGNISSATVGNHSVTFETQPDNLNGSGGSNVLVPTVTPKNGATDVSLSTKITLSFNEAVQDSSGRELTASRIADAIQLRRGSESGTSVAYSASMSNNNRTINITPDDNLRKDTEYYIILTNQSLRNSAGQYNSKQVFRFNTGNASGATTNPVDGADTIPVTTDITIKFSEAMHDPTASGTSTLSRSYIEDKLTLRRGSGSGSTVSFNASVSSDRKTITITPRSNLTTGTKYYVSLPAGALRNSSKDDSRAVSFSFTTADTDILVPKLDPASGSKDVSRNTDITLTFDTALFTSSGGTNVNRSYLENDVFTLRRDSASGSTVNFTADISTNRKVVTLSPDSQLRADTEYYLTMARGSLADGSSNSRDTNIKMTFTFSTGGTGSNKTMEPTVSPKEGDTGVAANTTIKLTFDERIYNTSGGDIKTAYLRDSVIELRKGSSTGTTVDFSAEMTNNYTITVTPTSKLENDKYYIIVRDRSLQNGDGTRNSKFTSYFTVGNTTSNVLSITVSPTEKDKYTGYILLNRNGSITLTFSEQLYYANGTPLDVKIAAHEELVKKNIKLTAPNSGSLSDISYRLELTNGKVLKITPTAALAQNTKHTLKVTAKAFRGSSSTVQNDALQVDFQTDNAQVVPTITTPNPTRTERKPTITFTFGKALYTNATTKPAPKTEEVEAAFTLRKGSTSGSIIPYELSLGTSNVTSFTITPSDNLDFDTTYWVVFKNNITDGKQLQSTDGIYGAVNYSFKVRQRTAVTASLAQNTTSEAFGNKLTLTFNTAVTDTNGVALTKNLFKIEEGASEATERFDFSTSNSSDKTTVTFTCKSGLLVPNTTYKVLFDAGVFKNSEEGTNAGTSVSVSTPEPTVKVSHNTPTKGSDGLYSATLTIESNYNEGEYALTLNAEEKFKKLVPKTPGSFTYVLKELDVETRYAIEVVYNFNGTNTVKATDSIFIDGPSKDATLSRVRVEANCLPGVVNLSDGEGQVITTGDNVTLTPVLADGKAAYTISAGRESSTDSPLTIVMGDAEITVTIIVTPEAGSAFEKTYTITLTPE